MDTLAYIAEKYKLDLTQRSPIQFGLHRDQLAALYPELGFTVGAEIGVEQGLYSEVMCKANPNLHLYSVDAWTAYKGYRDHVSQEKLDGFYAATKERLAPYDCTIIKAFSHEASERIVNGSLDFVYIDGSHEFFQVTRDIFYWSPKVRKGGIIAGHDFKRDKGRDWVCHVKDVVQAWAYSHNINPWFVLRGDGNPSWMWVC
jgi:hypothetical protein